MIETGDVKVVAKIVATYVQGKAGRVFVFLESNDIGEHIEEDVGASIVVQINGELPVEVCQFHGNGAELFKMVSNRTSWELLFRREAKWV